MLYCYNIYFRAQQYHLVLMKLKLLIQYNTLHIQLSHGDENLILKDTILRLKLGMLKCCVNITLH